jgi:hypothetical protein
VGVEERLDWLFPSRRGWFDGVDLSLLDPGDEDERAVLIRADHPELAEMLEDELYEPALDEVNPRLHLAVHGVVTNQILAEEPPETWAAVQRLSGLGYERHEVLHMVSSAVAGQLWHVMSEKRPFDHQAYAATLDALPDSWEAERDEADDRG